MGSGSPSAEALCPLNGTHGHICCNNTFNRNVFSGTEAHSVPGHGNLKVDNYEVSFNADSLQLWFKADDSLWRVGAQPGPGAEYDFFGQSRGNGTLLAGPFKSLEPHSHEILSLWPPPEWEDFDKQYAQSLGSL